MFFDDYNFVTTYYKAIFETLPAECKTGYQVWIFIFFTKKMKFSVDVNVNFTFFVIKSLYKIVGKCLLGTAVFSLSRWRVSHSRFVPLLVQNPFTLLPKKRSTTAAVRLGQVQVGKIQTHFRLNKHSVLTALSTACSREPPSEVIRSLPHQKMLKSCYISP